MKRFTTVRIVLVGVTLSIVGLIALFPFLEVIRWVGNTDLKLQFLITDSETGSPIPNALIHIRADEHREFCDKPDQREFTLTTDINGTASTLSKNCMCSGSKGIFENTFNSHLPSWSVRVTAEGYLDLDIVQLDESVHPRNVQRGQPVATVEVVMKLMKDAQ